MTVSTGIYDAPPAMPAVKGHAVFNVTMVHPALGEISGVFDIVQLSDPESATSKEVKIVGLWHGKLTEV